MAQISTVLVPCLVIQLNNTILGRDEETIKGQILNVPCRNDFIDDTNNYWLVPVKDSGVFSTLTPVPAVGDYAITGPTYDSIQVFRVRDKLSRQTWWVYGTWQNFIASCATCCGDAAVSMPGTTGTAVAVHIAPCQVLCIINDSGDFYGVFGIPTLSAGERFFPYGSLNNVAFTSGSASGYPDIASLLVFLNASWTGFVWTNTGNTLFATGGDENDSLCVTILNINPSA